MRELHKLKLFLGIIYRTRIKENVLDKRENNSRCKIFAKFVNEYKNGSFAELNTLT